MSEIIAEKIYLRKLFSDDFFFCIPEYQRPYSWQKDNCEQLFEDIYESNRDHEYFLVTIIIKQDEKVGTGYKYDIIDGQQRITTLQLLLACLRDNVANKSYRDSTQNKIYEKHNPADGIPEKVRLEVREKDFFKKYIQEEGGTDNLNNFEYRNDAQENLLNAIVIFRERLNNLNQKEIEELIEHLAQRCVLIYVSTKDFEDAYRLFTIINDRGLQLRRIDILKTSNLDPSVIKDPDERLEYSKIWEMMENDLGSDEFENLISFIRTIEIKDKAKEDILKEFNKLIFNKGIINKGKDFIEYLRDYKDIYQRLILDKDIFDKNLDQKTNAIPYKNLVDIMINFLPSNEWIPPLMLFYKKFQTDKFLDFLFFLEKKFVSDWVIALTPTKRIVNMNAILKEIQKANDSDELLKSEVFNVDSISLKYEFQQNIYGKRYAKYILLKLEYLESEQNVERKYGTITVEHVLPQSPQENSEWASIFDQSSHKLWVDKIANLVLLSKKKNSSASNLDFVTKKEKYLKGRMTDLSRSQKLLSYIEWTPSVLESRQKKILQRLLE